MPKCVSGCCVQRTVNARMACTGGGTLLCHLSSRMPIVSSSNEPNACRLLPGCPVQRIVDARMARTGGGRLRVTVASHGRQQHAAWCAALASQNPRLRRKGVVPVLRMHAYRLVLVGAQAWQRADCFGQPKW